MSGATKNAIDLLNLDKSTWESYRFDNIAAKISETVNPSETELEIYVGLEHIDAEDIHIHRKGVPSDVSGGKLKCYPGDVIFGKRRAYQRKAAVVDFEGICSAHAFVLRANAEVIDPRLFPFFLHSDQFMHRMIDISVGGLSPTINWGDLKHQEFLLPPKDQQAKLAELLWAMEDMLEKEKEVLEKLEVNKKANLESFFKENTNEQQLKNLGQIVTGSTPSTKKSEFWDGNIQFVTPADIEDQIEIRKTERYISKEGLDVTREIPANSVMVVCIASVGKMAISTEICATNQQINTIIPHKDIGPKYLFNTLSIFKHKIISRAAKSVVPILNKGDFSLIKFPVLEKGERDSLVQVADRFDLSIQNLKIKLLSTHTLQKSLINQVF
ncbi:type I restriction enzyme, S subunit [Spirosomataceae bacterium TFI 002]|nr:type I restriction enzyme, S subunit [Spirosomataceae bacterium TFI 002]